MKTLIAAQVSMVSALIRKRLLKPGLMLTIAAVLATGCATPLKTPSAELDAAERAIGNAERAQTIRYTSTELNAARSELAAARNAVTAKDMLQAQRLALQSQASAELAQARADLIKAQAINQDMQQSIDVLQQEVQRNLSGVKP
ncbi:DUF4398 domain-containing protein [Lacimicrobium alkaliphilum]|uniref:DUF4398 domain-containing protein n=1 Tax=Lacimicrobium alkaliphilum TaxID=1526571 RepID=A0A0U3B027_9ALTE|nr:DUF4398 domain-containing protein [Lacimicrobium alkaliphilum]ALS99727.1 hypothetical protein AT746_16610 [Lacimicrobium alkaliphilum]